MRWYDNENPHLVMQKIYSETSMYVRMRSFFDLLTMRQQSCALAIHAHEYLEFCLFTVEFEYGLAAEAMMFIASLSEFTFIADRNLYVWKSKGHVIFIHKDGAYAIFKRSYPFDQSDLRIHLSEVPYYMETRPLVLVQNKAGESIW